jgi:hypothetical protein
VPFAKPLVRLYSIPYAVTAEQPLDVIVPANVAVVVVIAEAAPVVTVGAVLIQFPITATFTAAVVPPPPTGIFPL